MHDRTLLLASRLPAPTEFIHFPREP
ncbi:MAG: hypothetical protein RL067_1165, partial [Verrucomicrobiota bacterium]